MHRVRRRPWSRKTRNALIGIGTLIGITIAISLATSHVSPPRGNTAATSAAPSVAAFSPSSCPSRAVSWRDNGGGSQLQAVIADMENVKKLALDFGTDLSAGADSSADQVALQSAAAWLQSDSQTAQANLPPSCLPHLQADYSAALNEASTAAHYCQNAVSNVGSGDYNVATDDVTTADIAITVSQNKFQAATSDLQAFNSG